MVDYDKFHVITSNEYLDILQWKSREKETIEQVKKAKRNEREENMVRWVVEVINVEEQAIKRLIERQLRVYFNLAWSTLAIKEVGGNFHNNIHKVWLGAQTKETNKKDNQDHKNSTCGVGKAYSSAQIKEIIKI